MGAESETHGSQLVVTVHKCSNLKDTNPKFSSKIPKILRQDPYVILDYGGIKKKTKPCYGGHKDPTFEQKIDFYADQASHPLNIEVWDKDILTRDDFIGKASIPHDYLSKCAGDIEYSLQNGAGKIQLHIDWPKGVNGLVTPQGSHLGH